MKRELGLIDCARIIAALEYFADEYDDQGDAEEYRSLAEEIASCDRVIAITTDPIE